MLTVCYRQLSIADSQHNQYDKYLLLCVQYCLLMMDSKSVRNM